MSDPSKDPTERMRLLQGDRIILEERIEVVERRIRGLYLLVIILVLVIGIAAFR